MDTAAPRNLVVNHWAVAFLDLLGQRDALRKMDFVPDARDEAKVAELIEAVRESVMVIQRFHGLYEASREGANIERLGPLDHLPPEVQQRANELRSTEVRSIRFSDGLVVWSSLVRSPKHSPVRALYELICTCGTLMFMSLAWGHPIRGGLDVGTGIEVEGEQLFGPAVVKAYELESKPHGAEFPRIVVGRTLTDYVTSQANRVGDVWVQIDAQTAAGIRELLGQDTDGHTIIDYMGAGFKAKVSNNVDRALVQRAYEFVACERDRFKRLGNEKLTGRYQRLVEYFDRKAAVWL
jgi:hypothetical protein